MSQYLNLKVKEVVKETEDAVTLVFEKPVDPVSYKSGQFLTLIIPINGEKLRRSYSLCSAFGVDEEMAVTVKRVTHGKVSNFVADNLHANTLIEVMQPMGNFVFQPDYHKKRDIVLLGAGSGITPLMSILKAALNQEPQSNVYLVYGNRNENSIIFKNQINSLKQEHGERLKVIHVLSQPINPGTVPSGRLNRSLIIKLLESFNSLSKEKAEYYVCGPEGMMDEALEALKILNVHNEQIHKESFITSGAEAKSGQVVPENQSGPKEVTIIYQGSEYKVTVPEGKSILQSALDEDIDLPFSCQSGLCTACMGKCTSGKVHLEEQDGLSENEINAGFVLTCVGHPVTGDVVIEID